MDADYTSRSHPRLEEEARLLHVRNDTIASADRTLQTGVEDSPLALAVLALHVYQTVENEVSDLHLVRSLSIAVTTEGSVAFGTTFAVAVLTYNFARDLHVDVFPCVQIFERTNHFLSNILRSGYHALFWLWIHISSQVISMAQLIV